MAKKPNVFGAVMDEMLQEDARKEAAQKSTSPAVEPRQDNTEVLTPPEVPSAFQRGAVGALASELRRNASNSLRDIDTDLIDASPFADRMEFGEAEIRDLAESIRKHGLRVPILLRPSIGTPGRFIIVYGRRRLAALRLLGVPARALVRPMDEEEAILAQGQENNERLDPSFIEKALYAASLEAAGYPTDLRAEALCVSKPYLSHMRRVVTHIDREILKTIGPAHGVGWKRWHDAVDRIEKAAIRPPCPSPESFTPDMDGSERFEVWLGLIKSAAAAAVGPSIDGHQAIDRKEKNIKIPVFSSHSGKKIGDVRRSGGRIFLSADPRETEFARWLEVNGTKLLERLHEEWSDSTNVGD